MRTPVKTLNLRNDNNIGLRMLIVGIAATFFLLAFASVAALATSSEDVGSTEEPEPIRVVESERTDESESVTLAIPVEEGAEIDLETSKNVRIDSWDGDEVLVIVERVLKPGNAPHTPNAKPMDIQIRRHGKDISIRAMNDLGVQGVDVYFRVVVPKSLTATPASTKDSYDLSKLTSVVLGALHKEAVRWVIR